MLDRIVESSSVDRHAHEDAATTDSRGQSYMIDAGWKHDDFPLRARDANLSIAYRRRRGLRNELIVLVILGMTVGLIDTPRLGFAVGDAEIAVGRHHGPSR